MIAVALFALLAIVILMKATIIVPKEHVYLLERLGKFQGELSNGAHFVVPFVDTISARYSLAEQSLKVAETLPTVDGYEMPVELTARYRILDAKKAHYNLANFEDGLRTLLTTYVKAEVGRRKEDDVRDDRRSIESAVAQAANEAAAQFGIRINDCTLS